MVRGLHPRGPGKTGGPWKYGIMTNVFFHFHIYIRENEQFKKGPCAINSHGPEQTRESHDPKFGTVGNSSLKQSIFQIFFGVLLDCSTQVGIR